MAGKAARVVVERLAPSFSALASFSNFYFLIFLRHASVSPLTSEVHLMPGRKTEVVGAKGRRIKVKPGKDFLRLDQPFNDAVRSKKASAVGEVLLRVPLTGKNARRTAKKVLAKASANRTDR